MKIIFPRIKKSAESLKATENDVKRKKSGINIVFITVAGFALLAALLLFAFKMQSVALIPAAGAAVSALLSFLLRPADKRALAEYEKSLKPLRQRLKGLIRIRRMFYSKFLFYRRGLRL